MMSVDLTVSWTLLEPAHSCTKCCSKYSCFLALEEPAEYWMGLPLALFSDDPSGSFAPQEGSTVAAPRARSRRLLTFVANLP